MVSIPRFLASWGFSILTSLSVKKDLTLISGNGAAQDLDEGRFPGTVVADQTLKPLPDLGAGQPLEGLSRTHSVSRSPPSSTKDPVPDSYPILKKE